MADPNRKINLDLPSSEDSSSEELEDTEITLVKEFENEFSKRFTDEDQVFVDFCREKAKPPPIVFPFEPYHHNNRGGHRGRFQNFRGGHRQHHFNDRRGRDHYNRDNYNRDNFRDRPRDHHPRDHHHRDQPPHKRPREDHPPRGSS